MPKACKWLKTVYSLAARASAASRSVIARVPGNSSPSTIVGCRQSSLHSYTFHMYLKVLSKVKLYSSSFECIPQLLASTPAFREPFRCSDMSIPQSLHLGG